MLNMDQTLSQLLEEISEKGVATHTTPNKKWCIKKEPERFWKTYCDLVEQGAELHMAEIATPIMPLIQDFHFKFVDETYDTDFISTLCTLYQNLLVKNYHIPDDYVLLVVVLESTKTWIEDGHTCIQLRIQFPNARVDNQLIRQEMIPLLKKNNIKSKIGEHVGDWESMMTSPKEVTLYGSGAIPLHEIHIWEKIEVEVDITDAFNPKHHQDKIPVKVTEFWIPYFLSIKYGRVNLQLKEKMEVKNFTKHDDENLDMALTLIAMISPSRFRQESSWLDIGKALYDVDTEKGLQVWIKTTQEAIGKVLPEWLEGDLTTACQYRYDTFGQSYITIKTLGFYAKMDSRKEYDAWHKQWCVDAMDIALSTIDTDVCKALYRMYWLDFIYDNENKMWYEFQVYGWCKNAKGFHLSKAISCQFRKKFEEMRVKLSNDSINADNNTKNNIELTIKKLTVLVGKLGTKPLKKRIMEEAEEFFGNEKLSIYMNKNYYLTGVTNGVLEIIGKDVIFRAAKPEDYISMCANVPLNPQLHWKHPLVKKCMNYLKKVFPDDELLHFFLKFASSFLKGRNSDKIFAIFSGCGNNSKSILIKLIMETFGVYSIKMPVTILSEKTANSGNASPQTARAANVKAVFLDEPEDDISLNKGAIKRWTGGDKFFSRKLNHDGGDIEMSFKLILCTNGIPPVRGDEATKSRLLVFPFLSRWVVGAPAGAKNVFELNKNFESELPMLAPAFLWICTQYYVKYETEGLVPPEIVLEHTKQYWEDNDQLGMFISECIKDDETSSVTLTKFYTEFRNWFKLAYPNMPSPPRNVVKDELTKRWGKISRNGWQGISLLDDNSPF